MSSRSNKRALVRCVSLVLFFGITQARVALAISPQPQPDKPSSVQKLESAGVVDNKANKQSSEDSPTGTSQAASRNKKEDADSTIAIDKGYEEKQIGIAGNPGAVNVLTGTGKLGELFGLTEETGVRLGGLGIANADLMMSGKYPGTATFNGMGIVDLQMDAEKIIGIKGGSFAATFLQFDGEFSNSKAGVITGYNGLTEGPPLNRSELYQLWWRQALFDEKLIIRVGKSIPTFDFNNVSRRLPIPDEKPYIASVSGLLFTPIFVNPSILGVMPGYYNSAWGSTVTVAPTKSTYASYGIYDGSGARGRQTGTHAWPTYDSYYFNIGEIGTSWTGSLPGRVAVGGWGQSGMMGSGAARESGAQGIYTTFSNRIVNISNEIGDGAIIGYFQYGINNSRVMMVNQYFGGGLTGFGIIPGRPKDSVGLGIGVSYLNNPPRNQKNEILTQMYYQAQVWGDIFFQPTFTYIPNPGAIENQATREGYPSATSLIFQMVALF